LRALDAQDFLFLHATENVVGEHAARHVPDVQFDAPGAGFPQRVRGVGHGVAAAHAVSQDELDVLACAEAELVGGGQLKAHHHHIGRHAGQAGDAGGHLDHRVVV